MDNRHIIMGTAGHIDHGKTTLIKALTGRETDYIKEEKERGITIDIGFAPFQLADGTTVGVIDVPGHERFIKNMLAGIGGIDFVLLVIDVNEGIMPQTTEHFHIIDMLGIKSGVIVLTKVDLAEPDWVDFVKEEIREQFAGTIFGQAPIIPASAIMGQGIDDIRAEIEKIAESVESKETVAAFRLPVDRIFSIAGFGTVVTGTALAGSIQIGDKLELLPSGKEARIRGIENHSHKVNAGYAGQRLAINITGIEAEDIERGMTLVEAGLYRPTELVDVRLQMIDPSPRELTNRARVRVYAGSSEVFARAVLLEHDKLDSGQTGLVQLRLESPLVVEAKDKMIIRFYSPMETIAGATVIDPHPGSYHKRFHPEVVADLLQKEKGGLADKIIDVLRKVGVANIQALSTELKAQDSKIIEVEVDKMLAADSLVYIADQKLYITRLELQHLLKTTQSLIMTYYDKNKYTRYVPKGQLHSEITKLTNKAAYKPKVLESIWSLPEFQGLFESEGEALALRTYQVTLSDSEQDLVEKLAQVYQKAGATPPTNKEVMEELKIRSDKVLIDMLMYLVETGQLVMVSEDMFFARQAIETMQAQLIELGQAKEKFLASDFRDQIGSSRKFAIALLEYFDRERITRRIGDERMLLHR